MARTSRTKKTARPRRPELEDLLYEVRRNVATITINRPKTLNALTGDTMRELVGALDAAGRDPRAGVIVITGAGDRAFSSGGDVNWEKQGGLARRRSRKLGLDRHGSCEPDGLTRHTRIESRSRRASGDPLR